jgi:mono/diheme cytochrome c family protein
MMIDRKRQIRSAAVAVVAVALVTSGFPEAPRDACAADPTSFAEDVMPIFRGRCVSCHQPGGEGLEKSGLDLTN